MKVCPCPFCCPSPYPSLLIPGTYLQDTLGDDSLWNFRELLAQVMQNLNINTVGSLGHSGVARTASSAICAEDSVVVANGLHLEHL